MSTCSVRENLRALEVDSDSEEEPSNHHTQFLKSAFGEIDIYKEARVDIDTNLIEYWQAKKYSYPFLRKLALIVHAVPATQVSVERAFSALKIILTDLRCNLSERTLRSLMFVKLNS